MSTAARRLCRSQPRLPFLSGVYNSHDEVNATKFAAWRGGNPIDVFTVFVTRGSWASQLNPWWTARPQPNTRLSVAVPLWPFDGSVATAASGGYNTQWQQFASLLRAGDYVRLAWEFNITWKGANDKKDDHFTTANASQWRAAWAQAYDTIKAVNPDITIVFNPNHGANQNGYSDDKAPYVNGKVDLVTLDMYDWWDPITSDAAWNTKVTQTGGLNYWLNHAKANGLKFGLDEWAVTHNGAGAGGDNPLFIRKVYEYLWANRGFIDHECYYNEPNGTISLQYVFPETANPLAAAEYKRQMRLLS